MTQGLADEGRAILGGDIAVTLAPARGGAGRARLARSARHGFRGRDAPRHGAARRRRGPGAGRTEGGRRRLSAGRRARGRGRRRRRGSLLAATDGAAGRARRTGVARPAPGSRSATASASAPGEFVLRGIIASEPDRLVRRLLLRAAPDDRRARRCDSTGLIQPGSLVEWRYRVLLPGRPVRRRESRPSARRRRRRFPKRRLAGADARPTPRPGSSATSSASPSS